MKWIITFIFFLTSLPAFATNTFPTYESEQSQARLYVELNPKTLDEMILVLNVTLKPGWHTYWKNPGHSGLPMQLDVTVNNEKISASTEYSLPTRITKGPFTTFGYPHKPDDYDTVDARFMKRFKIPNAKSATIYEVKASIKYLVCKEQCLVENTTLNFSYNSAWLKNKKAQSLAEKTYSSLWNKHSPQKITNAWNFSLTEKEDTITWVVSHDSFSELRILDFFVGPNVPLEFETPKIEYQDDDTYHITLKKSDLSIIKPRLQGLLVYMQNREDVEEQLWINLPWPNEKPFNFMPYLLFGLFLGLGSLSFLRLLKKP